MAVEGLAGIRVNVWDKEQNIFKSPSKSSFVWDTQGIAVSLCRNNCWDSFCVAGFPEIGKFCSCGIYTSHFEGFVNQYAKKQYAVWFLVEALGDHTWAYGDCHPGAICAWRAPAAQVLAVINYHRTEERTIQLEDNTISINSQAEGLLAAVDYFKVPVITLDQAREITRKKWEEAGFVWQPEFF